MTRIYTSCCFALMLCVLLPLAAIGQDSSRIVILSPRVGPVITLEDRDRYHIFNSIDRFQSATIFQAPDSTFYIVFGCEGPNNSSLEKRVSYPLAELLMLAEKINHFELLSSGDYRMGTDPAKLSYAGSSNPVSAKLLTPENTPAQSKSRIVGSVFPDLLPFASWRPATLSPEYPKFGFAVGVSSFPVDLSPISKVVESIKMHYMNQGYPITLNGPQENMLAPLWFSLDVQISPAIGLDLEAAATMGDEQVSLRVGSLNVYYYPELGMPDWARIFIGAGITFVRIASVKDLQSGSMISADSAGYYTTLDRVTFGGDHRSVAPKITGGVELGLTPGHIIGIRFDMSYILPTKHPMDLEGFPDPSTASNDIKAGGLILRTQLFIYL